MISNETDHKRFLNFLEKSQEGVWIIAQWLNNFGHVVTVNPIKRSKHYKDWKENVDDGDMYISKNGEPLKRVEVKNLGASFTCAEDWPYKEQFMVCAQYSYDYANPKPFIYIYLNKERTHVAIIKTETKKHWVVKSYTDKRYQDVKQNFYICPIEYVKFMPL
jgi:hypothetical protein